VNLPDINIRRAVPDDVHKLAELYDLVWSREVHLLGEKLAAERRADIDTIRNWLEQDAYFVVEQKDCVVAALGCEQRHGTLHLVHLVTHPDYRRSGYGEALMRRAEQHAMEIGAVKLWFDTAPGLKAAQRLYEKLGYRICGRLNRHYWGTDVILYEKVL